MYYMDIEDWVDMHPGRELGKTTRKIGEPRITIEFSDLHRFTEEILTGPFWWDELGRCYYKYGCRYKPAERKVIK